MRQLKKILILCDAHDCIRYEKADVVLLKQLYVIVFLLQRHFSKDEYLLHINNRALTGFEIFWKQGCQFYSFLDNYTIQKPWSDINIHEYDVVISHPEYQHELQSLLLYRSGTAYTSAVYSLLELQYECEMIYSSVAKLFTKGSMFEIDRSAENELVLAEFKQQFDQSGNYFNDSIQQAFISNMDKLSAKCNCRIEIHKIKKVLILDDYRRAFFIGDSVCWMRKIKQLADIFPLDCEIRVNVANRRPYKHIAEVLQPSFSPNISITYSDWSEIELREFPVVLCNTDILLKCLWHISEYSKVMADDILIYSFSLIREKSSRNQLTMDFYSNVYHSGFEVNLEQVEAKRAKNVYREIRLLDEEDMWANQWLEKNRVSESDKLVAILRGASFAEKVMNDIEILKFIKVISETGENVKILLVIEKREAGTPWIEEITSLAEYNKLVIVQELTLREVMSLLGNKQVVAIIGPCTGLMHLAEGVYTYLLNHRIIDDARRPMLLTYTGKQGPERNYHPKNWWKGSNVVNCCIYIKAKNESEGKKLISLEDCPADVGTFNEVSVCAREISGDLLMNFIVDRFPRFVKRLRNIV
jgi:hypothetical protein